MKFLGLGIPELVIILVVVLIIFGPKQLPKLGKMFGKGAKNLREGIESGKEKIDQKFDEVESEKADAAAEKVAAEAAEPAPAAEAAQAPEAAPAAEESETTAPVDKAGE